MPKSGFALILAALLLGAATVAGHAQESLGARMMMDRVGDIQTGAYSAGDNIRFALTRYAENYLLRFDRDPEIYVLYAGPGSLGGRTLKFDSGGTAIAISGWGGMTIYTDSQPGGLPADRSGEAVFPVLPAAVSLTAVQNAAHDEAAHLAYGRGLRLTFVTDWPALAADEALRALTFDALQNAARGIERFAANAHARAALVKKLDCIEMVRGGRPTIALRGKTLVVTFVPNRGFAGRASSHGIARALGQLLSVPTPG